MTGAGTQNDPFIVDNWPDFVTAAETTDAYVEFPEGGGIIDMNNYAPLGISTVNVKCNEINGNGWTIANLYCKDHDAFEQGRAKNVPVTDLHFLDIYFESTGQNMFFEPYDLSCWYQFYRCSFSGINIGQGGIFRAESVLEQCSANFCCNGNSALIRAGTYPWGKPINRFCNIRITGDSPAVLGNAAFENCYFSGKSVVQSIGVTYRSEGNFNVFNIDCTEASAFNCTGNSGALNLINTDLLPSGATIGTGFVGVTTAQLHDAAYLASLGFPIGVD